MGARPGRSLPRLSALPPGFGESDEAPHIAGMQDMIVHNLRLVAALGLDRRIWSATRWADGWRRNGGRCRRALRAAGPHRARGPEPSWTIPPPTSPTIGPEALPGYLAHNVDVALRYFPGGIECPPLEEFLAAREKEARPSEDILKVHGMVIPILAAGLVAFRRVVGRMGREGPYDAVIAGAGPGRADPDARTLSRSRRRPFRHAGSPTTVTAIGDFLAG